MPTAKEQLSALFKRIANAIRTKDGTTEEKDEIHPEDYPDRILAIETGIDTSDADAISEDIVEGKTAYVDGEKVIGTLTAATSGSTLPSQSGSTSATVSGSNLSVTTTVEDDTLVKGGTEIKMELPLSDFGDASTSDVLSGKTFTSTAGVKQTGTIVTRSSSSLSASGMTVTVPAGYYPSQVTKSISTVTQATPTISQSGTTITASSTQSAGYVSAGTKTATLTLSSAGSISGTLGSTSGASWSTSDPNRGSGTVSIKSVNQTAGYTAGYSNGTFSVSVPANRLLKGRTITPGTTNQLVGNAEDILYGAINVAGDANLIASNIKSGVSIFGVNGSYAGSTEHAGVFPTENVVSISSMTTTSVNLYYSMDTSYLNYHIASFINMRRWTGSYYTYAFLYVTKHKRAINTMDSYGEFITGNDIYGIGSYIITSASWSGKTLTVTFNSSIGSSAQTNYEVFGSLVLDNG